MRRQILTAVLVVGCCGLLIACGSSEAEQEAQETAIAADIFATQTAEAPAATPTPPPPTATPTPSATDTPTPILTPTAIPASDRPFAVGDFQLQITTVSLGTGMFAPVGMAEDETVLTVEVKVLSGNPEVVAETEGEFDVWTTDDGGRRNSTRSAMSTATGDGKILAIQWLFGVAESSESLYLHFPGGVAIDLSPLLP